MSSSFFDSNSYFVDEKVNFFKFENAYKIYDDAGQNIGSINQKINFGQKILQLFIGKSSMPFEIEIIDSKGEIQSTISRGWTFFLSKIMINDASGKKAGIIKQKFKLIKPTFQIFDAYDMFIAEINGNWRAWEFEITDPSNHQIGTISKKWAGAMRELFTSADKYHITINPNYSNKTNKIAILSGAIVIDMLLKEDK